MVDETPDAVDLGVAIQAKGWRQCSLFRPDNIEALPPHLKFVVDEEWLALCTQSCSVCAKGPDAEHTVEVIVAVPLATFDQKLNPAKGSSIRHLHLPVNKLQDTEALGFDISRRAIIPRELLANWTPSSVELPDESLIKFKAWISRYYARIALPDALDQRLKQGSKSVVKTLTRLLEKTLSARSATNQLETYKVKDDIFRCYIYWDPLHEELPQGKDYTVQIVIVCYRPETQRYLDKELAALASGLKGASNPYGLKMDAPTVFELDDVPLSTIAGMHNYTQWDKTEEPMSIIQTLSAG
jgi:hypothetical protein